VPASHESPAGTAPSVLLVEEYDALAAAFSSALKKFAPQHRVQVVESLRHAESLAAEIHPQVFIVDFDPPRSGALQFLQRIRLAHPEARFLAIVSGGPKELAVERFGPIGVHFVEKPFELHEFGATVQALLGPTEDASPESRGTLSDLNLRDLVPLACLNATTGVLTVTSDERVGAIHLRGGQIYHATTDAGKGSAALHEMMRWRNPQFGESAGADDCPNTIKGTWPQVFLEALRRTRNSLEEADIPEPILVPSSATEPGKPAAPTGKRILVIDDTEMLLIFVEDSLATADPTLQITTAFTGSEGARRTEVLLPDLVLLDYNLPDLPGDQVCARLLANEATARIPVVMMSGHVAEMLATAEKYENVVATIAKPFLSDALVALVMQTLAKGLRPVPPKKKFESAPPAVAASAIKPAANGRKPIQKKQPENGEAPVVAEASLTPLAPPQSSAIPVPPVESLPAPVLPPPAMVELPRPLPPAPTPVETAAVAALAPLAPPAPREVRPAEPALYQIPPAPPRTVAPAALATSNGAAVMLGLGMEVVSVKLTAGFRIDTIRARPTASTLSLTPPSPSSSENLLAGFEIGSVELEANGLIKTMRVVPTRRPAKSIRTRGAFAINDLALVNDSTSIEVTAKSESAMSMQLVAMFKVAGVELSDCFEVAQIVLKPEGSRVRISLDAQARSLAGIEFETTEVRLDASARIAELVLNSAL